MTPAWLFLVACALSAPKGEDRAFVEIGRSEWEVVPPRGFSLYKKEDHGYRWTRDAAGVYEEIIVRYTLMGPFEKGRFSPQCAGDAINSVVEGEHRGKRSFRYTCSSPKSSRAIEDVYALRLEDATAGYIRALLFAYMINDDKLVDWSKPPPVTERVSIRPSREAFEETRASLRPKGWLVPASAVPEKRLEDSGMPVRLLR